MRIFLLVLAIGCGTSDFQPLDRSGEGRVVGRVVHMDGTPAIDVPVHLALEKVRHATVRTDADGRFTFDAALSGRAQIVANDGFGNGAYRELSVYAAGVTDAGTMVMDLLRLEPRVLELRGVGFEERIATMGDGSYLLGNAPDGSLIVAVPENPRAVENNHSVYRLDPESGESALLTDVRLGVGRVLEDRLLFLNPPGDLRVFAIDLSSGETIYVSETNEDFYSVSGPQAIMDVGFLIIEHRDPPLPVIIGFDGSRKEGKPLPAQWIELVARDEAHAYFAAPKASREQVALISVDLASGDWVELASVENADGAFFGGSAYSADGALFLARNSKTASISAVSAVDLASGETTDLYTVACPRSSSCLTGLALDPIDGDLTVLEENRLVRIEDGVARTLATDLPAGSPAEHCLGPSPIDFCWLEPIGPDHVRVRGAGRIGGSYRYVFIDVVGDRVTRAITSEVLPYGSDFVQFFGARDPGRELAHATHDGGFLQLSIGPSGGDLAAFRRLTHLSVDHSGPLISDGGRFAYYVLDDPFRSGTGVFRVSLEAD